MITRRRLILAGASLPFVLTACGGEKASGEEPPSIKLGRTACDRCGMLISEERFASGIVDNDGNAVVFDDAGEMVMTIQEEGLNDRRAWVNGSPSIEWIDARDAWYVVTMEIPTPMGTGVFPFDTDAGATEFAEQNGGTVHSWDDLLASWTLAPPM